MSQNPANFVSREPPNYNALEQALHARRPKREDGLIHHSDHGKQYLSIRYSGRLIDAGLKASTGSVGDSYDNAMAETINGLYKTAYFGESDRRFG